MISTSITSSISTSTTSVSLLSQPSQDDQKVAVIYNVGTTAMQSSSTSTFQQEEVKTRKEVETKRSSAEDNFKLYKQTCLQGTTSKGRDIVHGFTFFPRSRTGFFHTSIDIQGTNDPKNINKEDLRMVVNKKFSVDLNKIPCPQVLYDQVMGRRGQLAQQGLNVDGLKEKRSLAEYYKILFAGHRSINCKIDGSQLRDISAHNVTTLLPAKEDGSAHFRFGMHDIFPSESFYLVHAFDYEGNNAGIMTFYDTGSTNIGSGIGLTKDWKTLDVTGSSSSNVDIFKNGACAVIFKLTNERSRNEYTSKFASHVTRSALPAKIVGGQELPNQVKVVSKDGGPASFQEAILIQFTAINIIASKIKPNMSTDAFASEIHSQADDFIDAGEDFLKNPPQIPLT